ncbi:MAG TPA: helix-turn-helix domain-containing protein [Acidimicrobiales bacterium]|nr:helix-turn-helix domain-containing protein [Acidimicrobiales bacterium]
MTEPPPARPEAESPLERAVARVGDRWTLLVVSALLGGSMRFGDLAAAIGSIAPNVLSQRLKHLEREGVVVAEAYSSRPPRVTYRLTASGHELAGALRLLAQWGAAGEGAEGVRHPACGTPMEPRWWCPTCAVTVEGDPGQGDDGLTYA